MDVQPLMGAALSAKARLQINLAVSQVVDIKQVATFPDIVFPIIWFEEGISGLPTEVTNLMNLATTAPPIARTVITAVLIAVGLLLLLIAVWRLVRGANRLSSLQFNPGKDSPQFKMVDVANMSDAELRTKLLEFGFPVMPITGTTRKVMEKKLKILMENKNKANNEGRRSLSRYSSEEESDVDVKVKKDKKRATMAAPPSRTTLRKPLT
ncbi:LEM domain [Popillia japonica]|uniref:Scavenger receptor class B member 1 n=1 Tax=Popillia japonica TaxID=7064 RepID=A0AAW1N6W7_POPJA